MKPEAWKQLWNLFHEAAGLPADLRRDWLAAQHDLSGEMRLELESLLDYHNRRDNPLDRPPLPDATGPAPGARIGPWQVRHALGAGGTGTVYLADRCDGAFERQVAIKILEPLITGGTFATAFAREQRILADLDHPGIAHLLDAGRSPEGWLYLVMEHVAGLPLSSHCGADRPDWHVCLGLFLNICEAVAYAHRKLVVHGDLKPANIVLQPDPQSGALQPKLLDFGIARLLSEHRPDADAASSRSYTPGYASPEQIAGRPVGIGSDIFALGVMLFEMLSGRAPFGRAAGPPPAPDPHAAQDPHADPIAGYLEAIRQGPPNLPALPGRRRRPPEFDWIIARCVRYEAEERYLNVDRLIRDLRALGSHRPVYAKPPSAGYRVRKFMRRNWRWIAAGGAVATVVLGLGTLLAVEGRRTALALAASERHLTRAETTAGFLSALFAGADRTRTAGNTPTARELLDQGRAQLANNDTLDPQGRYPLVSALAEVYSNLGEYQSALELAENAQELAAATGDTERVIEARLLVGQTLFLKADLKASRAHLRQTVELMTGAEPADLKTRVHLAYGTTLQHLGDLPAAGAEFAAAEQSVAQAAPENAALQAEVLLRSGSWHWSNGDLQQAASRYAQAIDAHRRLPHRNLPELARAMDAHAAALYALARYPQAAAEFKETIALRRKVLGDRHRFTADSLSNFGALLYDMGHDLDAEAALREALAIYDQVLAAGNPTIAKTLNNLGLVRLRRHDPDEAERLFNRALDIHQAALGRNHLNVAGNLNNLGLVAEARGDLDKALRYYRESLQIQDGILDTDHPARGYALNNIGRVFFYQDKRDQALDMFREAYDLRRRALGEAHPALAQTLMWWGIANCARAQPEVALSQLAQANLILGTRLAADHPDVLAARGALAACRLARAPASGIEADVERQHVQALRLSRGPADPLSKVLTAMSETK